MVRKKLTNKDIMVLEHICEKYSLSFSQELSFLDNLKLLLGEKCENKTNTSISRKVKKKQIKEAFPSDYIYKMGFIDKDILVGLIIRANETELFLKKKKNLMEGIRINQIIPFMINDYDVYIIQNKKYFKKKLNSYFEESLFEEKRGVFDKDPQELIRNLILGNSLTTAQIYQIHFYTIEGGKKLRIRAYADTGDLMKKFRNKYFSDISTKSNEDQKDLLSNFISISFFDDNNKSTLKITRFNTNQYLFRWQTRNSLSNKLSKELGIDKEECLLVNKSNEKKVISDFFREDKILKYAEINIFNEIIQKYSDYIMIGNKSAPKIKTKQVILHLKEILKSEGFNLDIMSLIRKKKIYFPASKKRGEKFPDILVIKKGKKIIQYILINQELLFDQGLEYTIKEYFPLVPFIILDFRKKQSEEFENKLTNDLIISSGEFIYNLKNSTNHIKELLTSKVRDLSNEQFSNHYYKVACDILNDFDRINKGLISQEKGALFEVLCFIILSKVFLTRMLGGRYKADGKFMLEDEKILYDAKNLNPTKGNPLLKSITYKKRIKDIKYIKDEMVSNYVFILKDIGNEHFLEVKRKIENLTKNRCTVSGITLQVLKDIIDLYNRDPRKLSKEKLKSILCGGNLVKQIDEKQITISRSSL